MSDNESSEPEAPKAETLLAGNTKRKSRAVYDKEKVLETKVETIPPKKRNQTEAQKAATQKMLQGLKARREITKKAQEEEAEMLKAEKDELKIQARQREQLEKAKLQKRKLPPPSERPTYITAAELQKFKLEMLDVLKPQRIIKEREVEVAVEKIVEKPVIVEKLIEKNTTKLVSGNALLDSIFFK
jgi:hypothetical protein